MADSFAKLEGPSIQLRGVTVSFPLYHAASRSLKNSLLFHSSAGRIARGVNQRLAVEALRDISLCLKAGDRVALIGTNGAGKTSLLRVMAGVYEPPVGEIIVRGHVSPMFDIGLGIDGELSGYENIHLRGLMLGLSRSEIEGKLQDITAFTELGDFLEMPVRIYSAGMLLRLTFAIATCFRPEILLMDEWIVAGDASFMKRAKRRLEAFVSEASVLVLASHDFEICRRWCNKAIWMDRGQIVAFGAIDDITKAYQESANAKFAAQA